MTSNSPERVFKCTECCVLIPESATVVDSNGRWHYRTHGESACSGGPCTLYIDSADTERINALLTLSPFWTRETLDRLVAYVNGASGTLTNDMLKYFRRIKSYVDGERDGR